MMFHKQGLLIKQTTPSKISLALFWVVWMVSSLLVNRVAMASPNPKKQPVHCQKAKQNMQMYFEKEKTIRDDVVIFSKLSDLLRHKIQIAYLGIEHELWELANKGILHQCDFGELEPAGLAVHISDDGKFRLYYWISDYEVTENLGYNYVMYAQPKHTNFQAAKYKEKTYREFVKIITIPKPEKVSDSNNIDFPVYAVIYQSYLRGNQRIHCEPYIEFYQIKQNKNSSYIVNKKIPFLGAKREAINKLTFFTNGCDDEQSNTQYKLDNQFQYDANTQVLSFRLTVRNDHASVIGHTQKLYHFWFSGDDFVQINQYN